MDEWGFALSYLRLVRLIVWIFFQTKSEDGAEIERRERTERTSSRRAGRRATAATDILILPRSILCHRTHSSWVLWSAWDQKRRLPLPLCDGFFLPLDKFSQVFPRVPIGLGFEPLDHAPEYELNSLQDRAQPRQMPIDPSRERAGTEPAHTLSSSSPPRTSPWDLSRVGLFS